MRPPPNRAFQQQPRGDQAEAGAGAERVGVAIAAGEVEDTAQAAAAAGSGRFEQRGGPQRVGVEDRKEVEQVAGVVDRCFIEQGQVLVLPAAADVEAGLAFAAGLHPGEQGEGFHRVHFAEEHRQGPQGFDRKYGFAHLSAAQMLLRVALAGPTHHGGAAKLHGESGKAQVEGRGAGHGQRYDPGLIADHLHH